MEKPGLVKMKDVSIADLKAAYDFNVLESKDLKKRLKLEGIKDYKNNAGYKELLIIRENLYMELTNRVNSIEYNFNIVL